LISVGAVLGANARYWFGLWVGQKWVTAFPLGTLIINISGSLVGILAVGLGVYLAKLL
jgi:CrcB protein